MRTRTKQAGETRRGLRLPSVHFWALLLALVGLLGSPSCSRLAAADPLPSPAKLEVFGDVVQVVRSLPVEIRAPAGADLYLWKHASTIEADEEGEALTIRKAPQGSVRIAVQILRIDWEAKRFRTETLALELLVGSAPAPDPAPPGPSPPGPAPDAAPFPASGLTVLILEETADRSGLPASQIQILGSTELRTWAKANCQQLGGAPALRIWDKDAQLDEATRKDWGAAFEAAKKSAKTYPWVVVANGRTGASLPLPATLADLLAVLAKFSK